MVLCMPQACKHAIEEKHGRALLDFLGLKCPLERGNPPPPDFLLRTEGRKIGLEHTRLFADFIVHFCAEKHMVAFNRSDHKHNLAFGTLQRGLKKLRMEVEGQNKGKRLVEVNMAGIQRTAKYIYRIGHT